MKLRRNEYCPIRRSVFCCGREQVRKERTVQLGVRRIEDPDHPREYRELRSSAEMRKLRRLAETGDSPSMQSAAGKCANNSETATFASALGRSITSPVNAFQYVSQ